MNMYVSAVVRMLPSIEWVVCFFPVALLLGDQILLQATGYSVLPYSHIDKGYFFVGMLAIIVVGVAVSVELRSSALGPDAFTTLDVPGKKFVLPTYGTTNKLVSSFFSKQLHKESTAPVIAYAVLLLVSEFAFGCMVAAFIFVAYLRG